MNDDIHTSAPPTAVKSAERVLDLFELLGRWEREMSHSEIADALAIPKSSLTLLLRTLVARGYVEYAPETKGYRLGGAFSTLARRSGRDFDLVESVEPILAGITATLGESSALNRLRGQMAEVVASVSSAQRLVLMMRTGDLAPLYATAGGKALLAYLPAEMQEEYLASVRFERITPKTISSVESLRKEIETVRRVGLAHTFEEFTDGIVGVATVILDVRGYPVGSLNVAMPAVRASSDALERAAQVLRRAAQEITQQIARAAGSANSPQTRSRRGN